MEPESEFLHCRVTIIIWITNYMHQATKKGNLESLPSLHNVHPGSHQTHTHHHVSHEEDQHESSHPSLDSSKLLFISLELISILVFHKSTLPLYIKQ